MDFWDFLLNDQVVQTFIGTMIAFGLNHFAESLEKNVFRPFIRKNVRITGQTKLGNVFSSFLELMMVLLLVYLVYRFIIKRTLMVQTTADKPAVQLQNQQPQPRATEMKTSNTNKLLIGGGKRPRLTRK